MSDTLQKIYSYQCILHVPPSPPLPSPPLPSPSKLTLLVTEFKYQELSGSHCSLLSTPCSSQEGLVFSSTSRGKKKRGLGNKTDTARAHHAFFSIGYLVCCSCSYWSSSHFIVEHLPASTQFFRCHRQFTGFHLYTMRVKHLA